MIFNGELMGATSPKLILVWWKREWTSVLYATYTVMWIASKAMIHFVLLCFSTFQYHVAMTAYISSSRSENSDISKIRIVMLSHRLY